MGIDTKNKNRTFYGSDLVIVICPICSLGIKRIQAGVESHLRTHIKRGQITIQARNAIVKDLFRVGNHANKEKYAEGFTVRAAIDEEYTKTAYHKIRILVLHKYGNTCICCKTTYEPFLQLDHVFNDGNIHRAEMKLYGEADLYTWAMHSGYPNNLQILCANCNHAKHKAEDKKCHCQDEKPKKLVFVSIKK